MIPNRPGLVVSPADGRVIFVERRADDRTFSRGDAARSASSCRSSTCTSTGFRPRARVYRISYRPGTVRRGRSSEASMRNEHNAVFMETELRQAAVLRSGGRADRAPHHLPRAGG
ncbi:MAG: hypothetical protein MZV70_37545 [Desulfobacterales bacterium]|nr:hypothetical protein [Desulfobacterales bacterium]